MKKQTQDVSRGIKTPYRPSSGIQDLSVTVHLEAAESESDAARNLIGAEWGLIDSDCPVGFARHDSFCAFAVGFSRVEWDIRAHGFIEVLDCVRQHHRLDADLGRQFGDCRRLNRLRESVVELLQQFHGLLVEDLIGDSSRLAQHRPAGLSISVSAQRFALIKKTLSQSIDSDPI